MVQYETVIGLEVHAQLLTRSKCFGYEPIDVKAEENTQIGPVALGLPGALPVFNKKVAELATRAGVALNCQINPESVFSRKNYFYPDLPKGYQISQFDKPICTGGSLEINVDGKTKVIDLERIHIEEDAGKSMHLAQATLVNLNRSGVPLIEIVSKPAMSSAKEAVAYLKKLHAILVYAEISDGNLEEGNFRCDVNISIRPVGQKELGTRSEIKNINSFRFVEKALEFEVARHIAVVDSGGKIVQETRGWDSATSKTFSMRSKEEASDYRYFPEPDLPPLHLDEAFIEKIRNEMPELPDQKKERFVRDYSLSEYDASVLTSEKALAKYFEKSVGAGSSPKLAANWILSEVLRVVKEREISIEQCSVNEERLCSILKLIEDKSISGKIAKMLFEEMIENPASAQEIVKEKGWVQVSDPETLNKWIEEVILANPKQVEQYRGGKNKLFAFFVGNVMKISKGKANPELLSKNLKEKLNA